MLAQCGGCMLAVRLLARYISCSGHSYSEIWDIIVQSSTAELPSTLYPAGDSAANEPNDLARKLFMRKASGLDGDTRRKAVVILGAMSLLQSDKKKISSGILWLIFMGLGYSSRPEYADMSLLQNFSTFILSLQSLADCGLLALTPWQSFIVVLQARHGYFSSVASQ